MRPRSSVPLNIGLYFASVMLIVGNIGKTTILWKDVGAEQSSNKALGAFLAGAEAHREAIIVPEPDYLLESLSYYAKNKIYLVREDRFGSSVSLTTDGALFYLVSYIGARSIKSPMEISMIVLGHRC